MQKHIPVLLHEAIDSLQLWRPTIKCIIDMTFGAGGYTKHIIGTFLNNTAFQKIFQMLKKSTG